MQTHSHRATCGFLDRLDLRYTFPRCTDLQSLVKSLDHRGIVLALDTFPQGNLWFARFRVYFTPVDGLDQTGD